MAKAAAAAGASVVVASRSRAGVDKAVGELPPGAEGHTVDATDENAVRDFFEQIGPFDHLAYTAGEPLMSSALVDTTLEAARRFFRTRYFGALTAVKYAVPHIRPGGSVVLTSGTASTRPVRGTTVVSSVLAAIEGLTRALAVELAPLRVNAVVPGIVRSELWDGLPESERQGMFDALERSLLVGPRVGEPADVVETYLYLMGSRHTTGSTLTVDGGQTLV